MFVRKQRLVAFIFVSVVAAAFVYGKFRSRGPERLHVESSKPEEAEPEIASDETPPSNRAARPHVEAAPIQRKEEAPRPSPPARHQLPNSSGALADLAEALRTSSRDTWRERAVREQVEKSFAADANGVELRLLQCTPDLCRADFGMAATADAGKGTVPDTGELMQHLATMAPHGDMVITTNNAVAEDGTAVAFIARYGTMLPHAER